jgi:hypothetical protein
MKKQILFLLLFLLYNFVSGQNTFTLLISDSTNEYPGDIIELSDHSFVLSSGFFTSSPDQATQKFFKINDKGKITHDTIFENSQGRSNLSTMVYINDTNIFCVGDWGNLNENDQKWVVSIDSAFNINWSKKYQFNYNYVKTASAFLNSKGKIISAATASNSSNYALHYLSFEEYTVSGDSVRFTIDSSAVYPNIFDMAEFPNNGMYRAAVSGYGQNAPGQILMIDSSFMIVDIDPMPNGVYWYNAIKKINDSSYYLSGNVHVNTSYDYAVMSMNENNICKKISILSQGDTINYAGIIQSMDFIDPNKVFLGATSNLALYSGHYGEQNSWYALSNFDSSLNLRWTKYYGGDAYYILESVVATMDGGVIMTGTRYDYPTQSYKCDMYIVKVNENGVLTDDNHLLPPPIHDAIVYPNPGTDHLIIQSGPQVSGAEFRMLSINGMQVFSKNLTERKMIVNTRDFSSGTYVWQIVFNDRVVETGKWIKD